MIPALYLSHGAPPLVDDAVWVSQLGAWARELPTPSAILVVSAHWEAAPLTIGSTTTATPLTYDFWGLPQHYYDVTYDAPGAPDLDALIDFRHQAPGMPYAHPTIEHFSPLFVALGASSDPEQSPQQVIDGYWMDLAKRSIELA